MNKRDLNLTKIIAVILTVIAFVVFGSFGYMFLSRLFNDMSAYHNHSGGGGGGGGASSNVSAHTERPSVNPTLPPTPMTTVRPTQSPTMSPTQDPEIRSRNSEQTSSDSFAEFVDVMYGLKCLYPSDFEIYDDNLSTLYTVRSHDGSMIEKINAEPLNGRTLAHFHDEFININRGLVSVDEVYDNYFVVLIYKDEMLYYKLCYTDNENAYWVEFIGPNSNSDLCLYYIQMITDSFVIY